jgi:hypothetical protein
MESIDGEAVDAPVTRTPFRKAFRKVWLHDASGLDQMDEFERV